MNEDRIKDLEAEVVSLRDDLGALEARHLTLQAEVKELKTVLRDVTRNEECKHAVSAHWQGGDC